MLYCLLVLIRVCLLRIEADMEAEYRDKMDSLDKARKEAEERLEQQQQSYESKLKVRACDV